jgi:hypothetical protein
MYIYFIINTFSKGHRFIKTFLHIKHARYQLSLDGAGFRGLDVDSVNSVRIIFRIYVSLQVRPLSIRKECYLRIDLTFGDRL